MTLSVTHDGFAGGVPPGLFTPKRAMISGGRWAGAGACAGTGELVALDVSGAEIGAAAAATP